MSASLIATLHQPSCYASPTLENGKVKKRTLANLSDWPPEMVEQFQALLRGEVVAAGKLEAAFEIVRSRPHGHVVAVLGTLRCLKLEPILCTRKSRHRDARRSNGGRTSDCSVFQIGDGT